MNRIERIDNGQSNHFFVGFEHPVKPPFRFMHYAHIPRCKAWIDTVFKSNCGINYAHSGQIHWAVDGAEPRVLTAPVAWWTWPGPRFCYGQPQAPGWDHYYVTFQGAWVNQLLRAGWVPSNPSKACCFVNNPEAFRTKMERMQFSLDHHDPDRAWLLLQELFLELRVQKKPDAPAGPHEEKLRSLMARIRRQPARVWIEAEAARFCGVSRAHFRRMFRVAAGLPFRQFCLKVRMEAAALMLRKKNQPLKEVAERCGVPDIYYFTRLFRSHHGVPPGAYRRDARMLG
jgi:AraC-like DNA-binding protein